VSAVGAGITSVAQTTADRTQTEGARAAASRSTSTLLCVATVPPSFRFRRGQRAGDETPDLPPMQASGVVPSPLRRSGQVSAGEGARGTGRRGSRRAAPVSTPKPNLHLGTTRC
jgi:hypothetical protein